MPPNSNLTQLRFVLLMQKLCHFIRSRNKLLGAGAGGLSDRIQSAACLLAFRNEFPL